MKYEADEYQMLRYYDDYDALTFDFSKKTEKKITKALKLYDDFIKKNKYPSFTKLFLHYANKYGDNLSYYDSDVRIREEEGAWTQGLIYELGEPLTLKYFNEFADKIEKKLRVVEKVEYKKPKVVKKVKDKKPKVVEKVEDEKPRDIQDNPDIVAQMKRATINDVPQDVMNNIMGSYLGIKDKANFNKVSKNLKINYSEKEKNRAFYKQFEDITEKYREQTIFSFLSALDNINNMGQNITRVNDVIGRYYKKYGEAQKKQEVKFRRYISGRYLSQNVKDYLIKYFVSDNEFNNLTQYEYDDYEDYYGNFWKFDGDNISIYTTATKEVRSDIKNIPKLITKYFDTIMELIKLYVNKIGDKIVELPFNTNELYKMTKN